MTISLSFKSYDDYINDPNLNNTDFILNQAANYINHKKEGGRAYSYNGYPGVTSVLGMMDPGAQAGLEQWRRKLRAEGKDPAAVTKQYADVGTVVHYAVETRLQPLVYIEPPSWPVDEYPSNCEELVGNSIAQWDMLTAGPNPILTFENVKCEMFKKNEQYRYSGFYDIYAVVNGKTTIIDLKSSPKCKQSYYLQLGAYSLYFDKCPEQGMIINICPDDRNYAQRPSVTTLNHEQLLQAQQGWIDMITAFHELYDEYLPITDSKKDAPLRNALQM